MKFFWQDTKGLKADVERHRALEKEYMDKIAELEDSEDPMDIARLRVYRRFLNQLQISKANVVDKIGKKK
jgi:hypothetical protein